MAGLRRRPLLTVAAAGGVALTSIGAAARLTSGADRGAGADGVLALSTHSGSDVQSLHLALDDRMLPRTGSHRWESRRLPTSTHSMVAFTWRDQDDPPITQVRARRRGSWTSWLSVPPLVDIPDGEDVGGDRLRGTDLVWIGRADGVQIRVDGRRPPDLTLVLLYPAPRLSDDLSATSVGRSLAPKRTGEAGVPRPELVTRQQWGADESLRDGEPSYNQTLKQVHVHHTVNANDYRREDVPALIRGMYAYHTQTLGWSDIAYNFLVDRFGRAFVGRAGGPRRLVRGAHTLGFNAESTGVSAIGNYETAHPSDVMLDAIAGIAAWKLDPYDRDPRATIRVESEGSDKYAAGRTVRLPVIDGHRDTNATACPGRYLYEDLPKVRRRAARIIQAAHEPPIVVQEAASITGDATLGSTLTVAPGRYSPEDAQATFRWLREGTPVDGEQGQSYMLRPEDVGSVMSCSMTLRKTGYEPVVQLPTVTGPVSASPLLRVTSSARRGTVRVQVDVEQPPGVADTPTGVVEVALGDRRKTVALAAAQAIVRFGRNKRLSPGNYDIDVRYPGSPPFLAAEWAGRVTVD